jgi:DNA-directed RNA polymerase specialized sigma24 family protein
MGCSVGAVKSHVFTGLGRLRDRLGADSLTDSQGDEAVNS